MPRMNAATTKATTSAPRRISLITTPAFRGTGLAPLAEAVDPRSQATKTDKQPCGVIVDEERDRASDRRGSSDVWKTPHIAHRTILRVVKGYFPRDFVLHHGETARALRRVALGLEPWLFQASASTFRCNTKSSFVTRLRLLDRPGR